MDAGKIILDGEPREVLNSEKTRMLGVGIPKVTRLFQLLEEQKALHSKKVPIMAEEMGELVRGALKA